MNGFITMKVKFKILKHLYTYKKYLFVFCCKCTWNKRRRSQHTFVGFVEKIFNRSLTRIVPKWPRIKSELLIHLFIMRLLLLTCQVSITSGVLHFTKSTYNVDSDQILIVFILT